MKKYKYYAQDVNSDFTIIYKVDCKINTWWYMYMAKGIKGDGFDVWFHGRNMWCLDKSNFLKDKIIELTEDELFVKLL